MCARPMVVLLRTVFIQSVILCAETLVRDARSLCSLSIVPSLDSGAFAAAAVFLFFTTTTTARRTIKSPPRRSVKKTSIAIETREKSGESRSRMAEETEENFCRSSGIAGEWLFGLFSLTRSTKNKNRSFYLN